MSPPRANNLRQAYQYLASVIGMLEMTASTDLSAEQRDQIGIALCAATNALRLLQDAGDTAAQPGASACPAPPKARVESKKGGEPAVKSRSAEIALPPAAPEVAESSLRILVAEDEGTSQRILRNLLDRRGHQVTLVENGRLAVEELRRNRFDLILMDIEMPQMDGIDAIRFIRHRELQGPAIPIIAVTAHELTSWGDEELSRMIDGYIRKPIDAALLISAIESAVNRTARNLTVVAK